MNMLKPRLPVGLVEGWVGGLGEGWGEAVEWAAGLGVATSAVNLTFCRQCTAVADDSVIYQESNIEQENVEHA
jgi:hypothetical protein